jgi:hypothetical protein
MRKNPRRNEIGIRPAPGLQIIWHISSDQPDTMRLEPLI